jgi:hypothetical protein
VELEVAGRSSSIEAPERKLPIPDSRLQASAAGFCIIIELAKEIHHRAHQVDETLEALTRLLKFDTANIHIAVGDLDPWLTDPATVLATLREHSRVEIVDLIARLEKLNEATKAAVDFKTLHDLVPHPHTLNLPVSHPADYVPHASLKFPIVPVVILVLRETKLLIEEKTTIDRLISHVVVEAGSITILGFLGNKAGIWVGWLFGGVPGAVIGGLFGSVAGAWTGRTIGRAINRAAFQTAAKHYESAFETLRKITSSAVPDLERDDHQIRTEIKRQFDQKLQETRDLLREQLRKLEMQRESRLQAFCNSFPDTLLKIEKAHNRAEARYLRLYRLTIFERLLGRSPSKLLAARRIGRHFGKARRRLAATQQQYAGLPMPERWTFIRQWVVQMHVASPSLNRELRELDSAAWALATRANELLGRQSENEIGFASEFRAKLSCRLEQIYSRFYDQVKPVIDDVQIKKALMIKEAGPLGEDFNEAA